MSPTHTLSEPALERARAWLHAHARPVDLALYRYRFEDGAASAVAEALAAFQNPDGGFGRALEPDFRLPQSSPMATSVALQLLDEIALASDHPLVEGALGYLEASWDRARRGWDGVPLAVNDHPHAPWWQRSANASSPWGNPDAELVAAFAARPERLGAEWLADMLRAAVEALEASPPPLDVYVALCYLRLARVAPEPAAHAIRERLLADARSILDLAPEARAAAKDARTWWLAPAPDALLADALRPEVLEDLENEIPRQSEAGCWAPRWSWGDAYPEAWELARHEWCGHETVRTLSALAAWGLAPAGLRRRGAARPVQRHRDS